MISKKTLENFGSILNLGTRLNFLNIKLGLIDDIFVFTTKQVSFCYRISSVCAILVQIVCILYFILVILLADLTIIDFMLGLCIVFALTFALIGQVIFIRQLDESDFLFLLKKMVKTNQLMCKITIKISNIAHSSEF